jgi:hypothetical protein
MKQKKRMRKSESISEAAGGPSRPVDNGVSKVPVDAGAEPDKRCSSCEWAPNRGAFLESTADSFPPSSFVVIYRWHGQQP